MSREGQVTHGHGGLELSIETLEPDLLAMESSTDGTGGLPPVHLHPSQAERFRIHDGSVRAIVDGQEQIYGPGDAFEVPAGAPPA
jgi:quercetin dioxygenase-like cupin family protein